METDRGGVRPCDFRVVVYSGPTEYRDMSGLLDHMLGELCREQALHPVAALMAALVLLKRTKA